MKRILTFLILLNSAAFGKDNLELPSVSFIDNPGVWIGGGYEIKLEKSGVIRIIRPEHWECRFTSDFGRKASELSALIPSEYKKFSSVSISYCADHHVLGIGFGTIDGDSLHAYWAVDEVCRNGKKVPNWLSYAATEMTAIYESTKGICDDEMVMISFSNLSDPSQLSDLETNLEVRLKEAGTGQYEGFDILSNQGDGVLYLYGKSADKLFKSILPTLKSAALLKKGSAARLIYEFATESDRNRLVIISDQ